MPSLYEGFSLPAIEAMSCGVAVVATTGGALPEVVGTDGETGLLVPPDDPGALAGGHRPPARRPRAAGPARGGRPRAGGEPLHLAGDGGRDRRLLRGPARGTAAARGAAGRRSADRRPWRGSGLMLTVDYDRLGVGPGDLRPRPRLRVRAPRLRGGPTRRRRWWRSTPAPTRWPRCAARSAPWSRRASSPPDHPATAVQGDALAPALRRRHVRPGHRLGGARAHPRRHRRHARAGPGPAPGRDDGGDRAALRPRGDQLGALGRVPRHPGRPRAHLPALDAGAPAGLGRARADRVPPRARAALALLVAALPRRAVQRLAPGGRRRTTRCWSGTSSRRPS